MRNAAQLAKLSETTTRDRSSWIEVYYSIEKKTVYSKPGEDRFFIGYLINPCTKEDVEAYVNRVLSM